MLYSNISKTLKQHVVNLLGRKTSSKIVVIESDDWGTIRMPSQDVYDLISKKGLAISSSYNRYDSLATEDDLSALFEVLNSFRDQRGNHPAVTANCLTSNPNFEYIRESGFEEYFFESFVETLKRYPGCEKSFCLWKQGMSQGLFRPQFHGREHLSVTPWMDALRRKDWDALFGFEHGFWGHQIRDKNARRRHYLSAYDFNSSEESDYVCRVATEGMKLFEHIFGYHSQSFIAPNFVWSPKIEETLFACGADRIQSQRNQLIPVGQESDFRTKFHYTGQSNKYGQMYLVRNAFFEPSSDPAKDWVSSCLKDISRAFLWNTPAIISAHRVNFIGAIVPENRARNLLLFKTLLQRILREWPDVEFITSDQLGEIIIENCDK